MDMVTSGEIIIMASQQSVLVSIKLIKYRQEGTHINFVLMLFCRCRGYRGWSFEMRPF